MLRDYTNTFKINIITKVAEIDTNQFILEYT